MERASTARTTSRRAPRSSREPVVRTKRERSAAGGGKRRARAGRDRVEEGASRAGRKTRHLIFRALLSSSVSAPPPLPIVPARRGVVSRALLLLRARGVPERDVQVPPRESVHREPRPKRHPARFGGVSPSPRSPVDASPPFSDAPPPSPTAPASTTPRPPPNNVDVHARYPAMTPERINSHTRMGHIAPARRGVSAPSRDHGESWTRTQRHRAEEERASRGCGINVESPACADSIGLLVSRRRDV